MIPINQTKFGYPNGNCLAACLASIFEIPIDNVPDFGNRSDWYDNFTIWCIYKFELYPIDVTIASCEAGNIKPTGYHIINGTSKNGDFHHSVVGRDGELFHDPHPDGALKEPKSYTLFVRTFLE